MDKWRESSAGYLANHMARVFARALSRRIEPLGLAPGQFMVLLELWQKDGVSQKSIVQSLDVEQATIANTLARMERDGLILRRSHPADARAQTIHLTRKGRMLQPEAIACAEKVNGRALSSLGKQEREQFLTAMRLAIAALKMDEN
jgi:DNA-binding MarR family transcriptional regulator